MFRLLQSSVPIKHWKVYGVTCRPPYSVRTASTSTSTSLLSSSPTEDESTPNKAVITASLEVPLAESDKLPERGALELYRMTSVENVYAEDQEDDEKGGDSSEDDSERKKNETTFTPERILLDEREYAEPITLPNEDMVFEVTKNVAGLYFSKIIIQLGERNRDSAMSIYHFDVFGKYFENRLPTSDTQADWLYRQMVRLALTDGEIGMDEVRFSLDLSFAFFVIYYY